ncbi:MAG: hypothetical protein ACK4ND_19645, partial [Cytophagaceae bacterium]
KQGIGELYPNMPIRNLGMGGVGIANPNYEYINFQNPALLSAQRVLVRKDTITDTTSKFRLIHDRGDRFTRWEASMVNQNRQHLSPELNATTHSISINSLSYLFPVGNRWTSAISLNPFSNLSYSQYGQIMSDTGSLTTLSRGYGGLYQASISNSYTISRNFSAGLQTSYLFGRLRNESSEISDNLPIAVVVVSDNLVPMYEARNLQSTHYRGILLTPGFSYRGIINPRVANADDIVIMNLGLTYEFSPIMRVQEDESLQLLGLFERIGRDSLIQRRTENINFPASYKAGVGFEKPNKWNISTDFGYTGWSMFRTVNGIENLSNHMRVAVGGEVFRSTEEGGPLRRQAFRAGIAYSTGYITESGTDLQDISLSLGTTLPLGRRDPVNPLRPLSKLNLAVVVGQRNFPGHTELRERYVNVFAGFLINDRWFRKRRVG